MLSLCNSFWYTEDHRTNTEDYGAVKNAVIDQSFPFRLVGVIKMS